MLSDLMCFMYRKAARNIGGFYILLLAIGPHYEFQFSFIICRMGMIVLNSWICEA